MPATAATIEEPLPFNNPLTVVDRVIAGVVPGVATDPLKPFTEATLTDVTVPALGVIQVPLSERTLPDSEPGAGVKPLSVVVNGSSNVVACVPVKSSTFAVAAVIRPLNLAEGTWANCAFDTTFAPIAKVGEILVVPEAEPTTSPETVSVVGALASASAVAESARA